MDRCADPYDIVHFIAFCGKKNNEEYNRAAPANLKEKQKGFAEKKTKETADNEFEHLPPHAVLALKVYTISPQIPLGQFTQRFHSSTFR